MVGTRAKPRYLERSSHDLIEFWWALRLVYKENLLGDIPTDAYEGVRRVQQEIGEELAARGISGFS